MSSSLALLERYRAGYGAYLSALASADRARAAGDAVRVEDSVNAAGRVLGDLADAATALAALRIRQGTLPAEERLQVAEALSQVDQLAEDARATVADLMTRMREAQSDLAAELAEAGGGASPGTLLDRVG